MSRVKKKREEEYKRALGRIIDFETRDQHFDMATVTNLKLSSDFRYAKVYVDVPGNEKEREETISKFNEDSGFFRTQLARRLNTRHTPEITFYLDKSRGRMEKIEDILDEEEGKGEK